ncbi:MAG: ATP-binding protein [Chthoniobacteraceae bacterium]
MKIRLTPLSGFPAAVWAISWYVVAVILTAVFWGPFFSHVQFLAFFAVVAITAARSGAWWGMGASIGAVLTLCCAGVFPEDQIAIRATAMLANSSLIIWLGAMLRRGATENQTYQESIGDAVPDFVWAHDAGGVPLYVNARTLEYFGMSMEKFRREGWRRKVHPEDIGAFEKRFPAGNVPAAPHEFECRYRRHDGVYCWFASRAVPFLNARKEIVKWVGTSTNVEIRKRSELERERLLESERQARSDAEHASRMKDEFLATVSHELRTPLNAIVGWVYLLKSGKVEPDELKEGLSAIERNTRVQAELIEDLLDMGRIISGQIRLNVQTIDLALVIDSAIESVKPSIDAKQIRLHTIFDPLAGHLRGDPARLQQVMWNLLSNAIKFTSKGGRVEIIVEKLNSQVQITVSDTGEGIAQDFIPHLFERFRQADASTTRRHGGLGLGLAIVKQLVDLHGGTITATSDGEGKGASFRIRLPVPLAKPEEILGAGNGHRANARQEVADKDPERLKDVKMLIVDDEPDSREVVMRILRGYGAQVTAVKSAEQALAKLDSEHFDILISDIGMQEMDGYELIRRVRASARQSGNEISAVALTAYARSEDRCLAVQAGFDMFISKPVDPAELIAVVERCAARNKPVKASL